MNGVKIWLIGTIRYLFLFLFVFVAPLSAQLENGLVAYFPLDGNGSDLVSGANGTIYGATPAENRWEDSGKAYSFDGTDDYIEVPFQSTYSTDTFSFSLWVKPTATSSQHSSPLTFRASTRGHILYKTPQNNWGAWVGTGGSWAENVLGQIEVGNWQFIASTYASGSYKGYLDGDLIATISPNFSKNTSSPLRIGAGKTEGSPDFFFAGVVDEVRLYNRALSENEVKQLQIIDHPSYKDVSGLGYTYVDENQSTSGPWALLGYGSNGAFPSKLTTTSGQMDEGRQGSTVLNALGFAQSAPKLAITWTNSGNPKPNGGVSSYDHGVAFEFTNPSLLTMTAAQTPSAGAGSTNWSTVSTDPSTVLLNLEVIQGNPNLPGSMYARRETFGAMYGNAYGFAKSSSNAQLDWTVDGQAFNVLYLGLNGNNGYVAPGGGGSGNGYVPSTMAIWGQLESPPVNLHAVGTLNITENSSAGTVAGELNATDPNGDILTYALMPALPSEFSPVLWLDANDSSTIIQSSGAVSRWQDKSGNNYHFTQDSDTSRQPIYSTTSLNGMPAITFDGSNDYLSISSRLGFSANPNLSVFAVTSFISNIASDNRIFQLGNNSHSLAVAGGTGSWSWRFNGGNEIYNAVSLNTAAQQAWIRQDGSNYQASQFFYNGSEQTRVTGASDTSVPSDTTAISFLGAGASGGSWAQELSSNVRISELIVLNDSSGISRKAIETYLARKWGLNYPHATSNGIFEIESNGTLKSLVSLDRETVATLPITVRATDPNGNFTEEDFLVTVLDDGLEDTDSDGFLDSVEYHEGSDPTSNASIPGLEYGLTVWYPFDGNSSDMSGNGRHGTTHNGAGWAAGKVGQALSLDGVDDYIDAGDFEIGGAVTFAAWVKYDAFKSWSRVFDFGNGENNNNILMAHYQTTSSGRFSHRVTSTSTYELGGSNNLASNTWLHRVGVIEANGNMRLYLNGSLVASNASSFVLPTLTRTQQYIGRSNWSVDGYLDGLIDDFRIYNRALSATEVSNLHKLPNSDADGDGFSYSEEWEAGTNPNSSLSKPNLMDGLLLWYPLDGNTSDMSGNDRHATLNNANGTTTGFVNGKILKALDLDGVDDYLSVPHDTGLDLRRTMSLSLWLKLDTIPSTGYSTIMYKGGGSGGSSRTYSLWLENSSRFFHGTSADATDQQYADSANSTFTNNSWMHLVMLLDRNNGTIRAFKDKTLVASDTIRTTDTVSSSNPLLFGGSQESNSDYSDIDGQMDDIRLYNRVLYSFEIDNLYDAVVTDTDSDGLNDAEESLLYTNLTSSDTDGDGLTDFEEVMGYHTYEQINSSLTWSAAKADAESRGGYLATITSLEEKNKVDTIRSSNSWLGGSDTQTEGTWQWVTGEPWGYTFWNSSEPNGGTGENYLLTWNAGGNWNDYDSSTNGSYILEKEYFSNPNSQDTDGDGFPDFNETQVGTDPSSEASSLLHNDLIAHWKFDETSGVTGADSSGNNYHATIFNAGDGASSWASGKVGGAVQLDGVDDYLAIQNLFYNQVGQIPQVTVSAWVKTTKSSEGIVMSFDRSEYWRLSVGGPNNNGKIMFSTFSSSGTDLYGQTVVSDGTWHMITASYSNGTGAVSFYLDGITDGSATAHSGAALGRGTTRFGVFGANNEDVSFNTMDNGSRILLFQGLIDDARIYNRALSASEVYVLHELSNPTTPGGNAAPVNLSLSNLQINENQAIGSTVGQFSATDPDGDTITFQLVNGVGDSENSLFSLETNGILKTAVVFDYENNATNYSIRVRASDTQVASVEGSFAITLLDLDDTAPIITLNGSANITLQAGNVYLDANASWSDAVDGSGVIVASGEVNASIPGTYVLSFNYTDAAGNVAQTVTRTVIVVDTTAPIINLHGDANITHQAGNVYLDANASWSDAVDGSGVIVANGEVNASVPGVYVLSYDYTDAAGNAAQTVIRSVHVVDSTAPVISLLGDANITHEGGSPYLDANASWTDAVDGSGAILASGQVNTGTPGSYVLSFNYTDAAGNAAQTVTRTVQVVDSTAPVISLLGDANITHEGGSPYLDANASWADAVDESGTILASGQVNTGTPGSYVLSFNYTDAAGNAAQTVTRTVQVVDSTAPVISLLGDANITHEGGSPYLDANASWTDAVDGSGTILASGQVNTGIPGLYVLSFNYTDAAGNAAQTVTRTVQVVDSTAPAISLLGDANITHEAGNPYLDANASWTDAVDGSGTILASGQVNAGTPGSYVLSFNYTDAAGNVAETVTRTVTVVDTTMPVITLNGDANITHEAGNVYLDANASWTDAVDGSGIILASGEVNPSIPGTYLLGYDYTDVAGNSAQTVTRKVEVINLSPNALYVQGDSNLSVFENEPNGTWVANFEGFDGNPDHVLFYELVRVSDGNQSAEQNGSYGNLSEFEHLNVFHLDTNGSLTTLRPIDYEIDPLKFEIVVRITDQHGAYFEAPFWVNVLNVVEDLDNDGIEDHYDLDDDGDGYPDEVEETYGFNPRERWEYPEVPIVRTQELIEESNETLRFGMEILAEGGFEELQVGIEVFDLSGNLLLEKIFEWNATSVAKVTFLEDGFIRGQVIRYQAYAENLAGRTCGQLMEYRVGGVDTWWASDLELTGGWRESIWMGTYLPNLKNNWIYHLKLGWLFIEVDQQGGYWMWMSNNGWLWTNQENWPFLWANETADWLYPVYSGNKLYFYDYQIESFR